MGLELRQEDRSGKQVVYFDRVGKAFGERFLFRHANGLLRYGETVMLLGANGCGKSTLLHMLMGREEVTEGSIALGSRVVIGYLAQQEHPDDNRQTVLQFFREQAGVEEGEARGKLARFLFYGPDVFKSVSNLSGGEWTRLRFAVLMELKPNLLILDEPTNHLDIDSREVLEEALEEFPGTILAVSHDRYFIDRLADTIWSLEESGLRVIHGGLEEYRQQAVSEKPGTACETEAAPAPAPGKQRVSPPHAPRRNREEEIQAAEQELQRLDSQMMDDGVACDAIRLAELHEQRERLEEHLHRLYEEWLLHSE